MKELVRGVNEADPGDNALFAQWQDKLHAARARMRERSSRDGALIEVAAQHPLRDGELPNEEFSARLDAALDLYHALLVQGKAPVRIYVPGSVHMYQGVSDKVSLSEAGCAYLERKGVPRDVLLGDDANERYKGAEGVYNSSDECYVASRIFDDHALGEMHCVCSPAQLLRKALSYVQFGCVPLMHSVPLEDMFHSYVDEAFLYIPRLLEDDSGLQEDSAEADRLRRERRPRTEGESL